MRPYLSVLSMFIDSNKLGGWVRAGTAAALGLLISKWPLLSSIFSPEVQQALGVATAGVIVGVWSQLTKTPAAKVAMVDALAQDPESPVKGVILEATLAGRDLKAAVPESTTTVVAGTIGASNLARPSTPTVGG